MIVPGMPERDYHAHHALSSTGCRRILESPARFRYDMDHPQPPRETFDIGHAVHAKVLGVGAPIAVLNYVDYRSKAAQVERDDARDGGKVPILAAQALAINGMAEAVLAHPTARAHLEVAGIPEASVFATDPETGVELRARFDYLPEEGDRNVAVDLKTTAGTANAEGFAKSAATYGYHIQEAHYLHTLATVRGHRNAGVVFIVVEKDPPHMVAVHQLDELFAQIGQDDAKRAREIYRQCLDTDRWPGYPADIIQTSPPAWLIYQHQEHYDQEIEVA